MPSGDHCAVWGFDNDRRYPEKKKILSYVGILRFYSPRNNNDVLSWARAINGDLIQGFDEYQGLFKLFCTRLQALNVLHQLCT